MGRKLNMIVNALAAGERFDADESAVLARELESIEREVTKTIYPELRGLQYVPMIPGIDPGSATYTWRRSDMVGKAKVMANRGDDIPRVDVSIGENYTPIRTVAQMYDYTTDELRAFALAKSRGSNLQLDTARAEAARLLIARELDEIVSIGIASIAGITGFINNGDVGIIAATAAWSTLTPQGILADLQRMERQVFTQSKEVLPADTIYLPLAQYALVAQTPLGVNNDKTVLDFFLKNSMTIKAVMPWYRLTNAAVGSVTDRAVAARRDPAVAGAVVPLLFLAQPPQARGLGFDIPCEAKCGGTVVKQPLGMTYMDGV